MFIAERGIKIIEYLQDSLANIACATELCNANQ